MRCNRQKGCTICCTVDNFFPVYIVNKRIESFPSPAGMSLPTSPLAGIMTS
ncbi:MAG: hypothetical protein ACK55Z_04675 [bacterium]